jgi:hypothetical protein
MFDGLGANGNSTLDIKDKKEILFLDDFMMM